MRVVVLRLFTWDYPLHDSTLVSEVLEGKCDLRVGHGKCMRVVQVVVLDLRQQDGLQCRQVKKNGMQQ